MVNSIIGSFSIIYVFWGIYRIYLLTENPFKKPYIVKNTENTKD